MFSIQHLIWTLISAAVIAVVLILYEKKKPPLKQVINAAVIIALISEFFKVFSTMVLVPSGGVMTPYLPPDQLPFHLCYIQIFFILYVRFTKDLDRREIVLAYLYPTTILGGIAAILLPAVLRNGVPLEQAFTRVIAYQFFLHHALLIAFGVILARSGEIHWQKRYFGTTILILCTMVFASLYLNSIFSKPIYVDGKIVSVEFSANYFYTYQNPLGIPLTALWQWYLYLLILVLLGGGLVFIMYIPIFFRRRTEKMQQEITTQQEKKE